MTFNGPIGGLIDFAIGGGWGSEVPKENHSRVAVIRGTDIPKVAAGDFSTVPFRYESDKKVLNRILAPGDIVLETAGGSSANGQYTGRTLLITQEILDVLGPTICASFCKKLVLNKALVIPPYFYFYMQDLYKSGRVASYDSQSTGISNFQYEAFVNNEVLQLPKLELQTSVAAALSNLQCKINTNSQISKTLEDIAQTIFKSWFIDFDPVKAKMAGEKPAGMDAATAALFPDSMEDSELGIVPSGWKVTKLSSSLKLHKSTVKAGASTESVPYVPVDQIGAKDIFLKNSMPGSAAKTSLVSFRKNDILFGAMRPYFHKVVLAPFDGTTRTTTFVLRVINSNYLSHSLFTVNQENAVAFATNNSQGTTIPYAVWNNSFEDFPMVLPPEPTAKAFNDLVLPIIEYGYSLIAQNRSLVEIRNGLLPRLISGELQIPDEMLAS